MRKADFYHGLGQESASANKNQQRRFMLSQECSKLLSHSIKRLSRQVQPLFFKSKISGVRSMPVGYFRHRLSYNQWLAEPLLNDGLMSVGFMHFAKDALNRNLDIIKLSQATRNGNWGGYDVIRDLLKFTYPKYFANVWPRMVMQYLSIQPDDYIFVQTRPRYVGVYKALSTSTSVFKPTSKMLSCKVPGVSFNQDGLCHNGEVVDLGFCIEVEPVSPAAVQVPVSNASDALRRRLRVPTTTSHIEDLDKDIKAFLATIESPTQQVTK